MRVLALIIIGSALLLAGATTASASVLRTQAGCGTVVGPKWEDPAFGKSGNGWLVIAKGVTCSYAKQWATKLVKTPWRGEAGTKLRGPAGWRCLPRVGGTVSTKGSPGECRKGAKLISWGPKV